MSQTQLSESEQGERSVRQFANQLSPEAVAQAMLNMLHARGRQIEVQRQQKQQENAAEEEPAAEQKTGPESIDSTTSQSESPDTPVTR